jgi:hypothetical protein
MPSSPERLEIYTSSSLMVPSSKANKSLSCQQLALYMTKARRRKLHVLK